MKRAKCRCGKEVEKLQDQPVYFCSIECELRGLGLVQDLKLDPKTVDAMDEFWEKCCEIRYGRNIWELKK